MHFCYYRMMFRSIPFNGRNTSDLPLLIEDLSRGKQNVDTPAATGRAIWLGVHGDDPLTGLEQGIQTGNREIRRACEDDLERIHGILRS